MLARLFGSAAVEIPAALWQPAWQALPVLRRYEAHQGRLRALCQELLVHKVMSAAGGLELSADVQVSIAIQACLPILNLGLSWYRGWSGIIVYPSEFVARRRVQDEAGLVHEYEEVAAGEAWQHGPVVVSWCEHAEAAAPGAQAFNVVIHEFAHKLDLLDGEADGMPPFDRRVHPHLRPGEWRAALQDAYERLGAALDLIELDLPASVDPESAEADRYYARLPLDPYAAQDEGEFFAVSSETFFVDPQRLAQAFPDWYAQLTQFYRIDPLSC